MMKEQLSKNECKRIMLELLQAVEEICKDNHLKCFIGYGTLLGAVKYNGFIPWDDDIDIYMERSEYEKIIQILKYHLHDYPWIDLLDAGTINYYYPFAKIVDNRTVAKMENNVTAHGIWIDLFPIDNSSSNYLGASVQILLCAFLRAIIISATTDFSSNRLGRKKYIKLVLYKISSIIGIKKIQTFYINLCKKYNDIKTEYGANLAGGSGLKERMKKEVFFSEASYMFEQNSVIGTKYYDYYLTRQYGDYKKTPPEKKRGTHHITAWRIR